MTFCQNRDLISKNDPTLAPWFREFVCDYILRDQGRVRGAKIAWSRNLENAKFCFHIASPAPFRKLSGPAGSRSLRARVLRKLCEALPSNENFWLAKGSISGGCRANLFFGI